MGNLHLAMNELVFVKQRLLHIPFFVYSFFGSLQFLFSKYESVFCVYPNYK